MKILLPVIIFTSFCFLCASPLQAQFVKSIGGTNAEYGQAISYDAAGNIYVVGDFSGKADFNPGPGTFFLKSSCPCDESDQPLPDVFFAKYSKSGALLWANKIGGAGYDYGKAIGVDSLGNVYITGSFEQTADFDPGTAVKNLTSFGGKDIFIAKYNSNGAYVWAKNIGGVGFDEGNALSVSNSGVITVAGYFGFVADFDPSAGTASFDAGGTSDPFFARYDTNGNLVWAKDIAGNGESSAQSIFIDAAGFIYVAGNFFGTTDFNTGTGVFNLTGAGSKDAFYTKYTASGEFIWAAGIGAGADETAQSIVADKNGNVYATGYFSNTVDFNPGSAVFNLTSYGFWDAYLLKLNANGEFAWAKNMGGNQDDIGLSLGLDAQQNIYATGYFRGTASFSAGATLTSAGGIDVYIAVYKPTGSLLSLLREGGTADEWANSIAIDKKGFIYLTGYYTGNAQFVINGNVNTLTSAGLADVYFLKAKRASLETFAAANSAGFAMANTKPGDDDKVQLYQNTPNPFTTVTNIAYYLPAATKMRLSITDMSGREVLVLKDGYEQKGHYNIQVHASQLANGIYIYRLQTGNAIVTKKLVVGR